MSDFTIEQATEILNSKFAPWVLALDLSIVSLEGNAAVLRMPVTGQLMREGGIVCGQALLALADTSMVFGICATVGRFMPMTTISQTTNFMKPVSGSAVLAKADILRKGRTAAFGDVRLYPEGKMEPAVHVASTYALLGG